MTNHAILAALVSTAALTAIGSSTTSAAVVADRTTKEPSLVGSGRIHYYQSPDDDIRFHFDARGFFTNARGTIHFNHAISDGSGFVSDAWVKVDCLVVGGNSAVVTGTLTRTNVPNGQPIGTRMGFSVEDHGGHGRDRMGFSWGLVDGRELPKCMATGAFNKVIGGHYVVRPAPPPDPPTWFPSDE